MVNAHNQAEERLRTCGSEGRSASISSPRSLSWVVERPPEALLLAEQELWAAQAPHHDVGLVMVREPPIGKPIRAAFSIFHAP